jgi:hypothetical protein
VSEGEELALRAILDRLEEAGKILRRRDPVSVAASVASAWERIADPERALGRAARELLPASTGLTLPMVAWALRQTFDRAGAREHEEAARRVQPPPGYAAAPVRLTALILAGNVFTACVQPLSYALIARAPTLVKASSRDDVLPRLFRTALAEVDPDLADACEVVSFRGGSPALEATLLSRADVVSAYGSDATLGSIAARMRTTATFVPHGNGLGVGMVRGPALENESAAERAARAFALDIAAYDQRGCLSPHAIFVETNGSVGGERFAAMLADALEAVAADLPRGALSSSAGAAQLQWRGVAAVRGALREGEGFAVSYEAGGPLRISPGFRNVLVLDASADGFGRALAPLGAHLKIVGVAGAECASIAELFEPPLAPRITPAGQMQLPSLLSLADGRPPHEGLMRLIELG